MSASPSIPPSNGAVVAPRLNLSELDVAPELFSLVPRRLAELHELVPVARQNGTLTVAMARPENLVAIDELARHTALKIRPVRVTVEELQRALVRFYAGEGGGPKAPTVEDEADMATESTVSLSAEAQAADSAPAIRLPTHVMEQTI